MLKAEFVTLVRKLKSPVGCSTFSDAQMLIDLHRPAFPQILILFLW